MTQPTPVVFPDDVWGAITIPLQTGIPNQPAGDPALFYIVDFLRTFLATDKAAVAQWTIAGVAPLSPPVLTTVVGRPDDKTYRISIPDLPTLFIWRDGGTFDVWGEDWEIVRDKVKIVWVLPLAIPQNTQSQLPFANAMVKCIYDGIELGRTPSWQQPNDPDVLAVTQGSLLYTYAAFVHLILQSWRPTFVHITDTAKRTVGDFAAVEMTFEMIENRQIGTGDAARGYQPLKGADDSVYVATFVPFQSWLANTQYKSRDYVVPAASNGYFYQALFYGQSGAGTPVWPTTIDATVFDGSMVWKCIGLTAYNRWTPSTTYALNAFVVPPVANGFYYQATAPGISASSAPSFPTTPGAAVTDGTVVWTCVALTRELVVTGPLEKIAPTPV